MRGATHNARDVAQQIPKLPHADPGMVLAEDQGAASEQTRRKTETQSRGATTGISVRQPGRQHIDSHRLRRPGRVTGVDMT